MRLLFILRADLLHVGMREDDFLRVLIGREFGFDAGLEYETELRPFDRLRAECFCHMCFILTHLRKVCHEVKAAFYLPILSGPALEGLPVIDFGDRAEVGTKVVSRV